MNRMDNLYPCLTSIREHCHCDYEVLVVAYLFSAENLDAARRDFPWVQFIESNEVRGFSENNNLALSRARGRFCFVLNDDTVLHDDILSQLSSDFELLPANSAIVTPRLLNANGSLQLCGRPPYPAYKYVLQQWHLYREGIDDTLGKVPIKINATIEKNSGCSAYYTSDNFSESIGEDKIIDATCNNDASKQYLNNYKPELYATSNISGAAFMIKTDIFRELGWFDEKYFFTPEDIALSTLARKRGYGVYVDKAASLTHKWRTTASAISIAVRPASIRGSLIFFSDGSILRYGLLSIGVFAAEFCKFCKASIIYLLSHSEKNRITYLTFRANCSAIFTHRSPKELFIAWKKRI